MKRVWEGVVRDGEGRFVASKQAEAAVKVAPPMVGRGR
jgi:hypothetical protein